MALKRKDLLGLEELSREEIDLILETAVPCKQIFEREVKKLPTLRGKTIVTLFYEPSTRTRTSFEIAGKWMSADVVNISVSTSSVVKGESLKDTAKTLEALGTDVIIIRHQMAGAPHLVAASVGASVVNAGDGMHEHPTQGLLDLFTIKEKFGGFLGLKVAIVGDILHSRVAKSLIWGLTKFGCKVRVCGPATLIPPGIEALGVEVATDLLEAISGVNVIYVLRIQLERQKKGLFPSLAEYSRLYGISMDKLSRADVAPDVLIMHPGPANLGVEITEEVAYSSQSLIREQVKNGVAVRMAILYHLLSGGGVASEIAH